MLQMHNFAIALVFFFVGTDRLFSPATSFVRLRLFHRYLDQMDWKIQKHFHCLIGFDASKQSHQYWQPAHAHFSLLGNRPRSIGWNEAIREKENLLAFSQRINFDSTHCVTKYFEYIMMQLLCVWSGFACISISRWSTPCAFAHFFSQRQQ